MQFRIAPARKGANGMSDMIEAGKITVLLQQAEQGNQDAENQLFPLVEADLRQIAEKRLKGMKREVDLSATMLIDEAFAKLVGKNETQWLPGDRSKFFGYMARLMQL